MLVAKFPEFDVVHKVDPEGILTPFSGVLKVSEKKENLRDL